VLCGSALRNKGIQPLLDAICAYLPSPLERKEVKGVHPERNREIVLKVNPKEHLAALAFKVVCDRHGNLTFLRIYSGAIREGQQVYNPRTGKKERIAHIYHMHADERISVQKVEAGDIVAVVGLKETVTGDTLCDKPHPVLLESIDFPEPVVSMAVEPKTSDERRRLGDALSCLEREDPTFAYRVDVETGQTIISGMGELHLEVLGHRLTNDFKVEVRIGRPQVAYRQTVDGTGQGEARFARVIAGKNHFAAAKVSLEHAPNESHVAVIADTVKDKIPRPLAAAMELAAKNATLGGLGLGYPLINVRVRVLDVDFRPDESSELALEAAVDAAVKAAAENTRIVLLEPVVRLEVHVPEDRVGEILSDLNARRAEVHDMAAAGNYKTVRASAPISQMFGYANVLRSLSQGMASCTMEPHGYMPVPEERAGMS
jgi:elongation factor G